jgi:NAD+ kinase
MMKIAIGSRKLDSKLAIYVEEMLDIFRDHNCSVIVGVSLQKSLQDYVPELADLKTFRNHQDIISEQPDYLFSLGGDGTFLQSVHYVKDSNIPVVGINMGRLGFLATINKDEIAESLELFFQKKFKIEKRSILQLDTENDLFGKNPYALNEVTVHKKDSSSMITVHTTLDDEFLNSYWADGLIVATPTGSTAYSLSCGGPIILPGSLNHVITPIAPHNLNVRPVVIPDDLVIRLKIDGREGNYLISLDSRSKTIEPDFELVIRKADFHLNIVQLEHEHFLDKMIKKMQWGLDSRN